MNERGARRPFDSATDRIPAAPSTLRFIRSASAPLPATVRAHMAAQTGVTVVESYGMTEAASQITATPLQGGHPPGSVGCPVGVELEVVEPDGRRCAPDVVGRVRIRGDSVISAYAGGVATERFDDAGWLDTGDLGRLDSDGYLFLAGRCDDVINCGGELVHPAEVEEILLGEATVAEAAAPDLRTRCSAPYQWRGSARSARWDHRQRDALASRLRLRCEQHLSRAKRPVEFRIVPVLPPPVAGTIGCWPVVRLSRSGSTPGCTPRAPAASPNSCGITTDHSSVVTCFTFSSVG